MLGNIRLWLKNRSLRKLSGSAVKKMHEAATLLFVIREQRPDDAAKINKLLDEVLYPAIYAIDNIEEAICHTSKKNGAQKSTLTLVK